LVEKQAGGIRKAEASEADARRTTAKRRGMVPID